MELWLQVVCKDLAMVKSLGPISCPTARERSAARVCRADGVQVRASTDAVLCPTQGSKCKLSFARSVTTEVVTAVGQFL